MTVLCSRCGAHIVMKGTVAGCKKCNLGVHASDFRELDFGLSCAVLEPTHRWRNGLHTGEMVPCGNSRPCVKHG